MALSGRYVDGEIILYTPEAYYWSSYEGAHFVQLRFPGLRGLYSFQQFAAVLNRPEVIKARIAGASAATPPRLVPPPVVEARLVEGSAAGGGRRVVVQARSGKGSRMRLYQDGQLISDKSVSGPHLRARSRFRKRAMHAGSRRWPPTRAGWSRLRRCSRSSLGRAHRLASTACWSASTPMRSYGSS